MQKYKNDLKTDIARYYFVDASDFLFRFDTLLESGYSKTRHIKCFVDLLMGFECILKSHVLMGDKINSIPEAYKVLKKSSHNLSKLCDKANYLESRLKYEKVKNELGEFHVALRYSLDAYESFFPSFLPREDAKIDYSKTLTSFRWLKEMRNLLDELIGSIKDEFCGWVELDFDELIKSEIEMREFATEVMNI